MLLSENVSICDWPNFFLGFSGGYVVRAMISHRRHRRSRALRAMSLSSPKRNEPFAVS